MSLTPLETQVLKVIAMCNGLLPPEQLEDMAQLVYASESAIALENLSTQLDEYDVAVDEATAEQIEALGKALGLDPKYWSTLTRG
jgi:hypothetical protein